MARGVEKRRESHPALRAGHQRIYYGTVVVTGGSHTLGDAYSCKYLRHCAAIQCLLQDSVPGCRHFDRHVGSYNFSLADVVWGSLSEIAWFRAGVKRTLLYFATTPHFAQ